MVPKPFSRVLFRFGAFSSVPEAINDGEFETLRRQLEYQLIKEYEDADNSWTAKNPASTGHSRKEKFLLKISGGKERYLSCAGHLLRHRRPREQEFRGVQAFMVVFHAKHACRQDFRPVIPM